MRRTTLFLLVGLLVVVLGAGAWFWLKRDVLSWPWQKDTVTNTTNTNTVVVNNNVNQANANVVLANLPVAVQGTTAASGSLKLGAVSATISSLQTFSTYSGITPATGKQLLIIFIDAVAPTDAAKVDVGMSGVTLKVGKDSVGLHRYKIATTQISGDRGFLAFDIPTNTKQATLVSTVAGATSQVDLTISK